MTATKAPTGAPSWAVPCWVDHNTLYFELRGADGPQVIGFKRHELSRALAILFAKFEDESAGVPYLRPPVVAKALHKEGLDQQDMEKARLALHAMGILK